MGKLWLIYVRAHWKSSIFR